MVSINFTQKQNTKTETPKHETLNNTLVCRNEVLSSKLPISTWKLDANHTHHLHKVKTCQDKRIILYEGSKLEINTPERYLEQ